MRNPRKDQTRKDNKMAEVKPKKHRSLLEECLKRLENKEPAKAVEDAKDSAPADVNKKKRNTESTK